MEIPVGILIGNVRALIMLMTIAQLGEFVESDFESHTSEPHRKENQDLG